MLPPIVLASQSPARRQLLEAARIPFRVQPSYFDESQIQSPDPVELVQKLAAAKAEAVAAQQREPVLVIGADSVLYLGGEIKQLVKSGTSLQWACPGCGLSQHDEDAQFCKRCGTPLYPDSQASPASSPLANLPVGGKDRIG